MLKEVLSSSTAKMKQVLSPHLPQKDTSSSSVKQEKPHLVNPNKLVKSRGMTSQSKSSKGV